jgi:hypothetical protein
MASAFEAVSLKHKLKKKSTGSEAHQISKLIGAKLSMEVSSRGVKLTTYLHTLPMLIMSEVAPPLTHKSSWSAR